MLRYARPSSVSLFLAAIVVSVACAGGGSAPLVQDPLPRASWVATSSSGEGDYKPQLCLDGDMKTRWSSNFTDDEWLQIDFGAIRAISGVRLHWETAYGQDYDLFLSNDAQNWEKVYEVRWGDGNLDEIFFGERAGRYLKLKGLRRGTGWGYSLWELDPVAPDEMPILSASSAKDGSAPPLAMDGSLTSAWRSSSNGEESLTLDLRKDRDLGGVELHWLESFPVEYTVALSSDGQNWQEKIAVTDGDGAEDLHYFPRTSARWLRLTCRKGAGADYALSEIRLKSGDESWNPMRHFESLLTRFPEGALPRWIKREQEFWTIVGVQEDAEEGLFSEDGTFEPYNGAFSVMPFLLDGEKILTARNFDVTQALEDSHLPLPSVAWTGADLGLDVRAVAYGPAGKSVSALRYTVTNRGTAERSVRLALAVRPLQLNPSWQHGGFSKIGSADFPPENAGRIFRVHGRPVMLSLTAPSSVAALSRAQGDIFNHLAVGKLPESPSAADIDGVVTAGLVYDLKLAPGESAPVVVLYPMHPESVLPANVADPTAFFASTWNTQKESWRKVLSGWEIDYPHPGVTDLVRSNLAYMLLNRDFFAAQPGPRNYARAWMRDGSLSTATYLRFGMNPIAHGYLEWFSGLLDASGFIPPIVESGKPEIPGWARDWKEYDSQGEYVFAITQYYEFTRDKAFLRRHFPKVLNALAFMRKLIEERLTDKYKGTEFYGILPESNSHEGYFPAKHSYWDDFFGLKGYSDGVRLARELGDRANEARLQKELDEFRTNVYNSIRMVIQKKNIRYFPGCAELGDPDATSTSIGIMACGELPHILADSALAATLNSGYDEYMKGIRSRWEGGTWASFTPYEVRNIDALLRLGRRDDAVKLLTFMTGEPVRPRAWNHWGEVTHFNPRTGSYIGDMPHTWVGSDFVSAIRSSLLFEESDQVVLAAGMTAEWIKKGVAVTTMPTWYGRVSYSLKETAPGEVTLELSGNAAPPKGFLLRHPYGDRIQEALVNGQQVEAGVSEILLTGRGPLKVVIRYKP